MPQGCTASQLLAWPRTKVCWLLGSSVAFGATGPAVAPGMAVVVMVSSWEARQNDRKDVSV